MVAQAVSNHHQVQKAAGDAMKHYCLFALFISTALCAMEREKEPKVRFGATPTLPESQRPSTLYGRELTRTREAEGHKTRRKGSESKKKPKYTKSGVYTPEEMEAYFATRKPKPLSAKVLKELEMEIAQIEANPLSDLPDITQEVEATLQEISKQYPDIELYGDQEGFDAMSKQLAQLHRMLTDYAQKVDKRIATWNTKLTVPGIPVETRRLLIQQLMILQDAKRRVGQQLTGIIAYEHQIAQDRGQTVKSTESEAA